MKSVEKYNWTEGGMLEYSDGKYVQHDDYAALRADLETAREEIERMKKLLADIQEEVK
jgi:5-bromo-4-chloroindolyl phosphate hydrolysis protein